ncbi:MAG: hypothetical protein U0414_14375 [Polyangiaceae bacterium]
MRLSLTRAAAAFVAALCPGLALANPKPLPFTYTYPTLPKGTYEIEQFVDLDPVKALSTSTGEPTWYVATQLTTEIEIGITDRLELGLYGTFVPQPTDAFSNAPTLPNGNGAKQRLRYRFAEEEQLPIDVALYGELAENEREFEVEAKVILARKIGQLHLNMNLSTEFEFYYRGDQEIVLNPSVGLTYQVTPSFHPGIEYWLHAEVPLEEEGEEAEGFNLEPQNYVGPALMFNFGPAWWSLGGYFRLNSIGYALTPGDAFGPLWFRTVVGVGL